MKQVPQNVAQLIQQGNRQWQAQIRIDFESTRFDKSLSILAQDQAKVSYAAQLFNDSHLFTPSHPEPPFALLCDENHPPSKSNLSPCFVKRPHSDLQNPNPRPQESDPFYLNTMVLTSPPLPGNPYDHWNLINWFSNRYPHLGYFSNSISDAQGNIDNTLSFAFSPRKVPTICLVSSAFCTLRHFDILLLDQNNQIVDQWNFQKNTDKKISITTNSQFPSATQIKLKVHQIDQAYCPVHLLYFSFHYIVEFDEDAIIDFQIDHQKNQQQDVQLGALIFSKLTLRLWNQARCFDQLNRDSPYKNLLDNRCQITVNMILKNVNPPYTFCLGTFWLKNLWVQDTSSQVTLEAVDTLSMLKNWTVNEQLIINQSLSGQTLECSTSSLDSPKKKSSSSALVKSLKLSNPIKNKTFYDIVCMVAEQGGLSPLLIDRRLEKLSPQFWAINGGFTNQLSQLTNLLNAYAYTSHDGQNLNFTLVSSTDRVQPIPCRIFHTNEYIQCQTQHDQNTRANTLKISYRLEQLRPSHKAVSVKSQNFRPNRRRLLETGLIKYCGIIQYIYDPELLQIPDDQYKVGGPNTLPDGSIVYQEASWEICFEKPEHYAGFEVSEPFVRGRFEYKSEESIENNKHKITLSFYNFTTTAYGADYHNVKYDGTYHYRYIPSLDKAPDYFDDNKGDILWCKILVHTEDYIGSIYTGIQSVESAKKTMKPTNLKEKDINKRNQNNPPYCWEINLGEKVWIDRIDFGNTFILGKLEYTSENTSYGVLVKVWNYTEVAQNIQVSIYGISIEQQDFTQNLIVQDFQRQKQQGVQQAQIELSNIDSVELARNKGESLLLFYSIYSQKANFQVWADPRLEIGDQIAYQNLRYEQYSTAVIEGIQLNYEKGLKQTLKIIHKKPSQRVPHCFNGAFFNDQALF